MLSRIPECYCKDKKPRIFVDYSKVDLKFVFYCVHCRLILDKVDELKDSSLLEHVEKK